MKFSKEFKEALAHLPAEEKDKLLRRLLKKDVILANRLKFELLENKTVGDRRKEMEAKVLEQTEMMGKRFHSPGALMMRMRFLSGEITEHVKITKDKFGEAYLNLVMLVEVLKGCNEKIEERSQPNSKLCVYIIARSFKILVLIDKMHSDLFMEFEEKLHQLGQLIGNNDKLMQTAVFHGFDVNWPINGNIPENIAKLQKDLRARGYLR